MSLPQYYSILGVEPNATSDQIRAAYRRESLKTHPDRLGPKISATERRRATERFQTVADAYYVLSDPARRAEYDQIFRSRPASAFSSSADPDEQERTSRNFFDEFSKYFKDASGAFPSASPPSEGESSPEPEEIPRRPNADNVFGDVFADLLEPEVARVGHRWTWVGGAAGAALGYIVANIPGAVAGGFAGNRLGAIRDAKGKPVAQVFASLPGAQKAEILRALAMKVLGSMTS